MKFTDFNLQKNLMAAVEKAGFTEPSQVQQEAIPLVLEGKDLIAQAQTGTGKTAAFALPILEMMKNEGDVEMVVIVPTRELAIQVSDEIFKFGKFLNVNTATVYGGSSYSRQLKHINNASVIVATPGRFIDLLKSKKIEITPSYVILDEADEMLDMGFYDDIKEIFKYIPDERQTLMFSATMPRQIKELAQRILKNPAIVTVTKEEVTNTNIKQLYYVVDEYERDDALLRLLDFKNPVKSIIFCKMKRDVDRLATYLVAQGYAAKGLHGDMEQRQREEVIRSFKNGSLETLIATDVAARGLDVKDVSHVFNYQIPFDSESYVHRIGRTGRAGKDGTAVNIVTPQEFKGLIRIQKDVGNDMENRVIPTISDVKNRKTSSLLEKIRAEEILPNSLDIIETLKSEYDLLTVTQKIVSVLIAEEQVKGDDKIGKSTDQIKRLFDRLKNETHHRSGNRRGGGYRGNRNGGGGNRGGYRGNNNRSGGYKGNRNRSGGYKGKRTTNND
jgi:ATP-dependent RNA helicase DeaD